MPMLTDWINPYYYSILMICGINIILATSLNLISGFTGQFSIGHAGFMSVGAYVSAFLSLKIMAIAPQFADPSQWTSSLVFLAVMLAGGLASAAVGWLVGLPSLRLKGDYLAIVTLGFGEIIRVVVLNINEVGGARGLAGIPPYSDIFWVYGWVGLTVWILWRLVYSSKGRAMMAIREDEIAAEAMGIALTRTKVQSFVIGAFFAGIAGALFAHLIRYINPQSFDFNRSFEIIIMVVLGGMGSLSGSIVAAVMLTILREALRPLQEITRIDLRMIIYSLMLILLMLTRPRGLLGQREITQLFHRFKKQERLS